MDGRRTFDQPVTISPPDRSVMLITFCILYLTYLPWPGVGAIWTRSTNKNPGTDELREFARSGDGCESRDHRVPLVRSR